MKSFLNLIREHRHFLIVVTILIVIMTWPTIVYVFRTDMFWLPVDSGDTFIKIWEAWYLDHILADPQNYAFTTYSFYPNGMSLAYHIFTVPHMLLQRLLQLILPVTNAYNAASLLIIGLGCATAYIYLLYVIKDRRASLFGAIVFGFSGYIVGRTPQPDHTMLFFVPLALYLLHRALEENRIQFIIYSGLVAALVAFTGMYMFVCLFLTMGAYVVYFARLNWRNHGFWLKILVLGIMLGAAALARIAPMQADSQAFDGVLQKRAGMEQETDLLQNFINYANPIWNRLTTNRVTTSIVSLSIPGRWNGTYLGYVPLFLIGLGLIRPQFRRRMLPWLVLSLPFLVLRLGSQLTINGWQTGILLPKHYLNDLFPSLFRAFYSPDHFYIGVLMPLAIMVSYGMLAALQSAPARWSSCLLFVCTLLLAAEYYRSPEQPRIIPDEETAFLDWLKSEDDQEIRLINLPMNRGNSKQYLFYQTLSGYPQVEGLATRTPLQAYNYIRSNLLLETWQNKESIVCDSENRDAYLAALDQLERDGFTHIILHYHLLRGEIVAESFAAIEPAYENDYVAIYTPASLRGSCSG